MEHSKGTLNIILPGNGALEVYSNYYPPGDGALERYSNYYPPGDGALEGYSNYYPPGDEALERYSIYYPPDIMKIKFCSYSNAPLKYKSLENVYRFSLNIFYSNEHEANWE
jgi:hypothetical protein